MANKSGNAYGLTAFCPIKIETVGDRSSATLVRNCLQDLPRDHESPMAKIPNTYFFRFYVLNGLMYQSRPATEDQLKSPYLIFTSDFHGDLEPYVRGMWASAKDDIKEIWRYCVGFDRVSDSETFVDYIKKCQVKTTFYFNGSTDDSLAEQLKSLYLKQEFSKFVFDNQGIPASDLQRNFEAFVKETKPEVLAGPTWKAGAGDLKCMD